MSFEYYELRQQYMLFLQNYAERSDSIIAIIETSEKFVVVLNLLKFPKKKDVTECHILLNIIQQRLLDIQILVFCHGLYVRNVQFRLL